MAHSVLQASTAGSASGTGRGCINAAGATSTNDGNDKQGHGYASKASKASMAACALISGYCELIDADTKATDASDNGNHARVAGTAANASRRAAAAILPAAATGLRPGFAPVTSRNCNSNRPKAVQDMFPELRTTTKAGENLQEPRL